MLTDQQLIAAFVKSFDCEQSFSNDHPPPPELDAGVDPNDWNRRLWKPARIATSRGELRRLRGELGSRLPPLYEELVLTWRWLEVCAGNLRLFPNPPSSTLEPLIRRILQEPAFGEHLTSIGVIPFGFYTRDAWYDPICFDTRQRNAGDDCVVRVFDHEAMLSFNRIGGSQERWPSCRTMMMQLAGPIDGDAGASH
jgi:hypothetical protein